MTRIFVLVGLAAVVASGAQAQASNKAAPAHADAPKLAEMKLIAYDSAKYGSSAQRNRLLKKWDAEIKSLPR